MSPCPLPVLTTCFADIKVQVKMPRDTRAMEVYLDTLYLHRGQGTRHQNCSKPGARHQNRSKPGTRHQNRSKPGTCHQPCSKPGTCHQPGSKPGTRDTLPLPSPGRASSAPKAAFLPVFIRVCLNIYPSFSQHLFQFLPIFTPISPNIYPSLSQYLPQFLPIFTPISSNIYPSLSKFLPQFLPTFIPVYRSLSQFYPNFSQNSSQLSA